MPINAKWHETHVLPRGSKDEVRLAWHLAHQKFCGCRPIPASLAGLIGAPKAKRRVMVGMAAGLRAAPRAPAKANQRSANGATNQRTASKAAPPAQAAKPANAKRAQATKPAKAKRAAEAPFVSDKPRCRWATGNALEARYHDEEWGKPSHDDDHLFEMLILEGAQAGLSWDTILKKRENYRRAFDQFDAKKIARYDARKKAALMNDEGIVRNRLKIESAVDNARAFLATAKEYGSFDKFIWSFVGGKPLIGRRKSYVDVPARTEISDKMSKELKRRGFRFVGSTICYAFMQATGLANDHVAACFLAPR